ncbi:(2Fe-2S)-binding protein [bacterium]|nr:(2Fe-2S)-binding protein [bacterium]
MIEQDMRDTIICRCQDISLGEIMEAIDGGITDPEELKRFLHVGMGSCQGRTCGKLVTRILANVTGKSVYEIKQTSQRPPLVSVPMKEILGDNNE